MVATQWLMSLPLYGGEKIAYFGASTGTAAALSASARAEVSSPLFAVVSRGCSLDLTERDDIINVTVPTLLIVLGECPHPKFKNGDCSWCGAFI